MSSGEEEIDMAAITFQEFLIELVRARPCLYDKTHPDYFDTRGVKANNWEDVAHQLLEAGFSKLGESKTGGYFYQNDILYIYIIVLLLLVTYNIVIWKKKRHINWSVCCSKKRMLFLLLLILLFIVTKVKLSLATAIIIIIINC